MPCRCLVFFSAHSAGELKGLQRVDWDHLLPTMSSWLGTVKLVPLGAGPSEQQCCSLWSSCLGAMEPISPRSVSSEQQCSGLWCAWDWAQEVRAWKWGCRNVLSISGMVPFLPIVPSGVFPKLQSLEFYLILILWISLSEILRIRSVLDLGLF
jgi:hypothetical protein